MTLRALPNQTAGTGSAKTNLLGLLCLTIAEARPSETNWPGWRGPRGDGSSMDPNVPVKWTMTDDEVWKIRIPGTGHSSPVIWEERIFVVSAIEDGAERVLLSLDRKTGKILWRKSVSDCRKAGQGIQHRRDQRSQRKYPGLPCYQRWSDVHPRRGEPVLHRQRDRGLNGYSGGECEEWRDRQAVRSHGGCEL
jgi:hypothetical protein